MSGNHRGWIKGPGLIMSFGVLLAASMPLRAEPVTNRILSHYQLATRGECAILKVNFNIRIRYISHFPSEQGELLNIIVRAIDPGDDFYENVTSRESLRPPENNIAAVRSIVFESDATQGTVLSLQFLRPMTFNVALGQDFQSLLIALSDGNDGEACTPEDPFRSPAYETNIRSHDGETIAERRKVTRRETVIARRPAPKPVAPSSDWLTESEELPRQYVGTRDGDNFRQARIALRERDHEKAIKLLKEIDGPDALELLGVAYQKNGQTAEAKAVYQDYLRRYGNERGAEGVRQRLAGIDTAYATPETLRGSEQAGATSQEVRDTSYWSASASVSGFYIRDDSYQVIRDPTQPLDLNQEVDDREIHRDVFLSSADVFVAWGNSAHKSKFRFSGTHELNFGTGDEEYGDIVSVAALYYDTTINDWDFTTRIGRQTRSSNGVLSRFDGVYASWQSTPWLRFSVVGGSPVFSRKDEPYKDEKYFYGGAVNFGPVFGGFDASIFAIEQRARDVIDRQAIGTELRYADAEKSAFLTVDYDTHFGELNAAIFNGSWRFPDKSTIRAAADYRKSPYLTTSNALIGQQFATLFDLLQANTLAETEQAAIDRTATYKSASVGYTRQLTEKLQLNLDFTAVQIDGTIASFGVDAIPSTGTELYYSAQLIGNQLFTKDDIWTAAFRYSDVEISDNYAIDLSTRYLINKDWRVTPRMLLSYREGKDIDLEEYSVLPSLLMDYFWTKDLNLELEVGTRFTWLSQDAIESRDTEIFITAGFRYDFYAGSDRLE
jgi:hypothetical protein